MHNVGRPGPARKHGFTIIELVAVLVIVGALSVVVVPRLNPAGFERYVFRHELLSALRYAQKLAMGSGCEVAIAFDASADSYRVLMRTGGTATTCGPAGNLFDDPVQHPAGDGDYTGAAGAGADLQAVSPAGPLVFDGFGNRKSGPTSITLAGGPAIQIDAVTGYVHD